MDKRKIKPNQNNKKNLVSCRKVTLVIKTTKIHPNYIIHRKKPTQVNKKQNNNNQKKNNNTKNRVASDTCNPEKRHEYDRHECIFWKKYKNYHDAVII